MQLLILDRNSNVPNIKRELEEKGRNQEAYNIAYLLVHMLHQGQENIPAKAKTKKNTISDIMNTSTKTI